VNQLSDVLRRDVAKLPAGKGGWKDWPAQWAEDSVVASRIIYGELLFSKRFPKTGKYWMVYVNLKQDSKEKYVKLAEEQLAKATRHLADVLEAIQWAK
jgi:hypothetical protein